MLRTTSLAVYLLCHVRNILLEILLSNDHEKHLFGYTVVSNLHFLIVLSIIGVCDTVINSVIDSNWALYLYVCYFSNVVLLCLSQYRDLLALCWIVFMMF